MPTAEPVLAPASKIGLSLASARTKRPVVWSIAGSDSAACSGIQADLLSFEDLGARGCTAVTALTAQSECSVDAVYPVSSEQLAGQLDALSQGHAPCAIKLGLLANADLAAFLKDYLSAFTAPIVFDPVLRASAGAVLYDADGIDAQRDLLSLVTVLTPNIPEAELLCQHEIKDARDVVLAARRLLDLGARSVLIKGGHARFGGAHCWDYWMDASGGFWLRHVRQPGQYRGTGCSLSAALAAALASDWSTAAHEHQLLRDALVMACTYVQHGIRRAREFGTAVLVHGQMDLDCRDLPCICTDYGACATHGIAPWSDPEPGLYPVVPGSDWVGALATSGVRTVQLRIKTGQGGADASDAYLDAEIAKSRQLAHSHGVRLVVNDHWRAAIASGAYGVHLGQEDLAGADLASIAAAGLRLGISVHSWWELARALCLQPSYIAFGPVYATTSKPMSFSPIGVERLALWRALVATRCPCVAIGGISVSNVSEVWATGVDGVALISAIVDSDDWQGAVRRLRRPVDALAGREPLAETP